MGEDTNRNSQGSVEGNTDKEKQSSSTRTEAEGRGTGRGRGRPRGATEKEKSPQLVMVEDPSNPKGEEEEKPKKKGRGRPKGSTTKKKTTSTTSQKVDTKHIKILVKTVFDLMASRPNMQMWKLTEEEINEIEKPLAKVLERSNLTSEVAGKYGDVISLVVVTITIFAPKFIMWYMMKPKEEKRIEGNVKLRQVKQPTNEARKTSEPSGAVARQDTRKASVPNQTIGAELHDLIPSFQ